MQQQDFVKLIACSQLEDDFGAKLELSEVPPLAVL
ncbi:hypothetical protein DSC_14820 [Pseudoxanthomonas spadix BD-a59]|jgi:hypothetical protein|uniref:Uncharacterized protein n=1 Tax=Pseudoxanthomonas spadix (strain BD-a59) TaxID=1045855 RepID=G7UVE7_PSEUP|nr:hypothetical protein DSC_14820 [Pseudoxanthomonas spadix BD-a59]